MNVYLLKGLYTVGALLLLGAQAIHALPAALDPYMSGAIMYFAMHSFLPSAKVGKPQG